MADPIVTIEDIDEALWWVTITAPRDHRYPKIVDALLDQRLNADPADQDAHPAPPHHRREDHPGPHPTG